MIIPHGSDVLKPNDNVFLVGEPLALEEVQNDFTEKMDPVKKVMIIGAGRIGRNLATILEKAGMTVKVIDKNQERCQALAKLLKKGSVYCGEGTDLDLLMDEGVGDSDAVVCLTDDDKLNLLLALMAKDLGAQKTICRVGRTEYIPLMEKVGVDSVLSPRVITAGFILSQVRRGKFISVALLEGAKAQAMEIVVTPTSKAASRKLREVKLPRECLIGAVLHKGQVYIPNGESILEPGDNIVVFTLSDMLNKVNKFF